MSGQILPFRPRPSSTPSPSHRPASIGDGSRSARVTRLPSPVPSGVDASRRAHPSHPSDGAADARGGPGAEGKVTAPPSAAVVASVRPFAPRVVTGGIDEDLPPCA